MALWVDYRPDTARTPAAMSLNPEPAAPEEREANDLPPKSFADAAHEALEPQSHVNGADGAENTTQHGHVKTDGPRTNGVSVLKIVDTNGHQDDDKKSAGGSSKDSIKDSSSIKDQESYEGTGIDDTPKSPKGKTHRRKGSRSSLGSVGRTYGVSIKNDLKEAATDTQDKATDAAAAAKDGANEVKNELDGAREKLDDAFLQEKPRFINGDVLTTVKPPKEVEKDGRVDKPLKRRDSELKAGRQAGAGWAKSKYV